MLKVCIKILLSHFYRIPWRSRCPSVTSYSAYYWILGSFKRHSKYTVDSDVVEIAMHAFSILLNLEELWLEYRWKKTLQYFPICVLDRKLPQGIPDLLPFFQAFTVPSFANIRKSISWKVWMAFRDVNKGFFDLFKSSREYHWRWQALLIQTVNVAMRFLFTQQNRTIGNIPPTNNVLLHHLKRAFLQCSL